MFPRILCTYNIGSNANQPTQLPISLRKSTTKSHAKGLRKAGSTSVQDRRLAPHKKLQLTLLIVLQLPWSNFSICVLGIIVMTAGTRAQTLAQACWTTRNSSVHLVYLISRLPSTEWNDNEDHGQQKEDYGQQNDHHG